ncbi:MAG: ATP-binding protein [Thaumarchaeota archaeon]|nr:ATP-binding protein [Nitrososphaerota archaeon]
MMDTKIILAVLLLSVASSLALFGQNLGLVPSVYDFALGAVALIGCLVAVILVKKRGLIAYRRHQHNKPIGDNESFAKLLGINSLKPNGTTIIVKDFKNRIVAHAFYSIRDIPYTFDDLDREKRLYMVGNFVRILSNLNFGFELIPRVFPVAAEVYLKNIQKKIDDLRLTLNAEGSVANPGRQARLKQLERQSTRLLEGEGVRDVSFLAHIFVEGKNETAVLSQLENNAKSLSSALESGLNVRAKRLTNEDMIRVLTEFFPATVKTVPAHQVRMFTWDLAYIAPLTGPKLPPLEKLLTGTYLGRTGDGTIVSLDLARYPNPHMLVLGKSGYGKSTTVQSFISRSYDLDAIATLIIDYTGEYGKWVEGRKGQIIDMRKNTINPFELGPATLNDRMRQLVDAFQEICDFKTINQRNAFTYYVMRAYYNKGFHANRPGTWKNPPPTLGEVIKLMEVDFEKLHVTKQMTVMALLDRLRPLASGPFGVFGESTLSIEELTQGFTCIDLSRVTSNSMKDMVAWTVLQYVDSKMRLDGVQDGIRLHIVLDEAWKLCRDEDSLPVTLIKEGRKYGYSLIVSSQDATADFAESILANAGTVIVHHTEYPKYLRFLKLSYGLTDHEVERVQNLPVGEALIKIGDDPRPFFTRIEMEIPDEKVIVEHKREIRNEVNQFAWTFPTENPVPSTEKSPNAIVSQHQGNLRDFSFPDNVLSDNAKAMVKLIDSKPGLKTTEYYSLLNLNAYQGNKALQELLESSMIEAVEMHRLSGRGREGKVLRVTKPDTWRFGGAHHQYLIQAMAKQIRSLGHRVEVERPLSHGQRTDLLVDGEIAVELEMRDFSEENIRKNLDAGFKKVVVVCNHTHRVGEFKLEARKRGIDDPRVAFTGVVSLISGQYAVIVGKREGVS